MNKIFLLGVGCQKGGTTWLHDYIANHRQASMGFMKEYHIFDSLYVSECREFYEGTKRKALDVLGKNSLITEDHAQLFQKLSFYADVRNYFDYFNSLINQGLDIVVTGDITPSYSALPIEVFEQIKSHLEARDFEAKIIFLMRDPVERCISATRMYLRNQNIKATSSEEEALLKRLFQTKQFQIRTRYQDTIKRLETVFEPNSIYYGFYENLFHKKSIEEICTFLKIDYAEPDFSRELNVSKNKNNISIQLRKEIYDFYSETYQFIESKFPTHQLRKLWSGYGLGI